MSSENRHKQMQCNICLKIMRSDTLKRHLDNKHLPVGNHGLEDELREANESYFRTIEIGKYAFDMVTSGEIEQGSLSQMYAHAFNLYNKMRPILDVESAELRPWQQHVVLLLEKPTLRQVIWIKGCRGNAGKSWLQSYIQSMYGFARTVRLDFKSKANDIYLALSKRPLATTDIFLFNDSRSASIDIMPCYPALEAIKDGTAISSKYNSEVVRFKTPNTVIVFSNTNPDVIQLSRDRWQIFNIEADGLKPYGGKLCERKLSK